MVAIYHAYYNICRVHQTLWVTPAMEAGRAVLSTTLTLGLFQGCPSFNPTVRLRYKRWGQDFLDVGLVGVFSDVSYHLAAEA
jgi:hypothetical protein